jgi:mRNA interferase HigB
VRVISAGRIKKFCRSFPTAKTSLLAFLKIAREARWQNVTDLRRTYPHADSAVVRSKRIVTVINIRGNEFRLVIAVHYNTQRLFVLRFMTHAEYSRGTWKDTL